MIGYAMLAVTVVAIAIGGLALWAQIQAAILQAIGA
jgi:hypothetical protein